MSTKCNILQCNILLVCDRKGRCSCLNCSANLFCKIKSFPHQGGPGFHCQIHYTVLPSLSSQMLCVPPRNSIVVRLRRFGSNTFESISISVIQTFVSHAGSRMIFYMFRYVKVLSQCTLEKQSTQENNFSANFHPIYLKGWVSWSIYWRDLYLCLCILYFSITVEEISGSFQ